MIGPRALSVLLGCPECCDALRSAVSVARVKSVVCYRMTPKEKASVVSFVRAGGDITLAIGDGGNDVAMLQEAHVGVGIAGLEGLQAARAADFSFGRFRYLQPLLFVHGHYAYHRTVYIVQYCFYKSILLSAVQILYNIFFADLSGMSYWNSFLLALWNGFYTVAPILFYVLDRDLPREVLLQRPELYEWSRLGRGMTAMTFLRYIGRGLLHAVLLIMLTIGVIPWWSQPDGPSANSRELAFLVTGCAALWLQSVVVFVESHSITILNGLAIGLMPPIFIISVVAWAAIPLAGSDYWGAIRLITDPVAVLTVLLIAGAIGSLQVLTRFIARYYFAPPEGRDAAILNRTVQPAESFGGQV